MDRSENVGRHQESTLISNQEEINISKFVKIIRETQNSLISGGESDFDNTSLDGRSGAKVSYTQPSIGEDEKKVFGGMWSRIGFGMIKMSMKFSKILPTNLQTKWLLNNVCFAGKIFTDENKRQAILRAASSNVKDWEIFAKDLGEFGVDASEAAAAYSWRVFSNIDSGQRFELCRTLLSGTELTSREKAVMVQGGLQTIASEDQSQLMEEVFKKEGNVEQKKAFIRGAMMSHRGDNEAIKKLVTNIMSLVKEKDRMTFALVFLSEVKNVEEKKAVTQGIADSIMEIVEKVDDLNDKSAVIEGSIQSLPWKMSKEKFLLLENIFRRAKNIDEQKIILKGAMRAFQLSSIQLGEMTKTIAPLVEESDQAEFLQEIFKNLYADITNDKSRGIARKCMAEGMIKSMTSERRLEFAKNFLKEAKKVEDKEAVIEEVLSTLKPEDRKSFMFDLSKNVEGLDNYKIILKIIKYSEDIKNTEGFFSHRNFSLTDMLELGTEIVSRKTSEEDKIGVISFVMSETRTLDFNIRAKMFKDMMAQVKEENFDTVLGNIQNLSDLAVMTQVILQLTPDDNKLVLVQKWCEQAEKSDPWLATCRKNAILTGVMENAETFKTLSSVIRDHLAEMKLDECKNFILNGFSKTDGLDVETRKTIWQQMVDVLPEEHKDEIILSVWDGVRKIEDKMVVSGAMDTDAIEQLIEDKTTSLSTKISEAKKIWKTLKDQLPTSQNEVKEKGKICETERRAFEKLNTKIVMEHVERTALWSNLISRSPEDVETFFNQASSIQEKGAVLAGLFIVMPKKMSGFTDGADVKLLEAIVDSLGGEGADHAIAFFKSLTEKQQEALLAKRPYLEKSEAMFMKSALFEKEKMKQWAEESVLCKTVDTTHFSFVDLDCINELSKFFQKNLYKTWSDFVNENKSKGIAYVDQVLKDFCRNKIDLNVGGIRFKDNREQKVCIKVGDEDIIIDDYSGKSSNSAYILDILVRLVMAAVDDSKKEGLKKFSSQDYRGNLGEAFQELSAMEPSAQARAKKALVSILHMQHQGFWPYTVKSLRDKTQTDLGMSMTGLVYEVVEMSVDMQAPDILQFKKSIKALSNVPRTDVEKIWTQEGSLMVDMEINGAAPEALKINDWQTEVGLLGNCPTKGDGKVEHIPFYYLEE